MLSHLWLLAASSSSSLLAGGRHSAPGEMGGFPTFSPPAAIFCLLAASLADALEPLPIVASSLPEIANSFPNGEARHYRRPGPNRHVRAHQRGMPSKARGARDEAGPQLLSWSASEDPGWRGRPAGLRQKDIFLGLEIPYPEQENQAPGSDRGKKHHRGHRRHSRRDRSRQHRGICLEGVRPFLTGFLVASRTSVPRSGLVSGKLQQSLTWRLLGRKPAHASMQQQQQK